MYVNEDKMEIIKCLGLKEEELAYFTTNMKVCVLVAKIILGLGALRSDQSRGGRARALCDEKESVRHVLGVYVLCSERVGLRHAVTECAQRCVC